MSQSSFEAFLADLQQDSKLRAELEALGPDPGTWVQWAATKGYAITREDAGRLAESRDLDISDDDLEKVAGGWCGNEITSG